MRSHPDARSIPADEPPDPRAATTYAGSVAPRRRHPPRRRLRKLALLGASLAVSLLLLEVGVRVFDRPPSGFPFRALARPGPFTCRLRADAELDVPLSDGRSFHVTTNARGFRGPTAASIAGAALRILSIGDSFTLGWGVELSEHAMARAVSEHVGDRPGRDVGHAYLANPGWDPRDYWLAYLTEGRPARADLVVVGVFAGNDVMPLEAHPYDAPADVPVRDAPAGPPAPPLLRSFEWARSRLSNSLLVARVSLWAGYEPASFTRFRPDVTAQRRAWGTTFHYLSALDVAVRADGARLVIVSYPSSIQVNAHDALDAAGFDHTAPDRVLAGYCAERGVELVSLLEPLKAANAAQDLYFPSDRHLTARGNAVAAEAIRARLDPILDRIRDERARR